MSYKSINFPNLKFLIQFVFQFVKEIVARTKGHALTMMTAKQDFIVERTIAIKLEISKRYYTIVAKNVRKILHVLESCRIKIFPEEAVMLYTLISMNFSKRCILEQCCPASAMEQRFRLFHFWRCKVFIVCFYFQYLFLTFKISKVY